LADNDNNEEVIFKNNGKFVKSVTLTGRRLSGKPVVKGIYINNGKKVAIE